MDCGVVPKHSETTEVTENTEVMEVHHPHRDRDHYGR